MTTVSSFILKKNTYAAELLFVLDIMSLDTLKTSTFVN